MRTLCDACESAAAIVFCAADEAALCRSCDEKRNDLVICERAFVVRSCLLGLRTWLLVCSFSVVVCMTLMTSDQMVESVHMCNKLASRHVRVGLATPSDVPRCDICENAPAFFYCEVDGSSLCLQCDVIVHVGGKRTHGRYLLFRQRVEFPGDKPGLLEEPALKPVDPGETRRGQNLPPKLTMGENQQNHRASPGPISDANADGHPRMNKMIDLNMQPHRMHEQASNNQDQ